MSSATPPISARSLLPLVILAGALSACQSAYFGNAPQPAAPPQPLPAAPVGSVAQSELPPPGGQPGVAQNPTGMPGDPAVASQGAPGADGTQVASAPPTGGEPIGRTDLLGGWTVASGADRCQLFMSLTSWSGGYRASTRGCSSPALQNVSAWNISGNQVSLLDQSGATVARLYPSSKTQFNGQTETGSAISVMR
ncbi:AprI/Inh family metalloprotease inhibitor [Afifella pfennigii]|uniref:AprI/Inh family metalloprotease inhibitor n=1 Tax=Afifella pfennigii TaxID=209897 RepID=UPI000A02753E|nr:AprI/Inh family metalloprotease inhibitor [Afifella pfennigii]